MIQAAIFDMDGLLIDSEPIWQEAELSIFHGLGIPFTREDCIETRGWRVDEVVAYWHARRPWAGPTPSAVEAMLVETVREAIVERGAPLPGAIEAIEAMGSRFGRLALASSSPGVLIETVLEVLGVRQRFEVVHSAQGEDYGKPHPAVFLSAARRLEVDPTTCVVFEDSLAGVIAAKAARMRCVAVPERSERGDPRFTIADRVLDSLLELGSIDWASLG